MSVARLLSGLLVGSFGLVIACSSGSSTGASSSGGFVDEFCGIFASQCCAKNGYTADGQSCRNLYNNAAVGKEYDAARGEQCLAALRAAQNNADFCDKGPSEGACTGIYRASGGGAAPGAICEDDEDCASSNEGSVECVSSYSNESTTRTCQVQTRGKEGDACSGTKDGTSSTSFGSGDRDGGAPPSKVTICDTADKLYCNSANRTCARISDVGGPCEAGFGLHDCVENAFCHRTEKKCVERLGAGADCAGLELMSACVDKHYCDTSTKQCTATLPAEAACQKSEQCESRSCTNGKCTKSGLGELALALVCGPKTGN